MNKNIVITYLIIAIIVLVGYIMIVNYPVLSEWWLIWLMVILGAIGIGVGIIWLRHKS